MKYLSIFFVGYLIYIYIYIYFFFLFFFLNIIYYSCQFTDSDSQVVAASLRCLFLQ